MSRTVYARFSPFEGPALSYQVDTGKTVQEIIRAAPAVPSWFWEHGEVRINGKALPRDLWAWTRPKVSRPDRPIIVTLHASFAGGGGGGGSTKNTVVMVAAIALLVAGTLVTGGILGPEALAVGSTFAAGGWGAILGGAALTLGATALLTFGLTPPPVPVAEKEDAGKQTSDAGISGNSLTPMENLPVVLGKFRFSPPLLAPPHTVLVDDELILRAVVGLAGQYDKATLDASLLINGIPITEIENIVTQIRYGTPADLPLTICTDTVIEEPRNSQLTNFVLKPDSGSLDLMHQSDPDRDLPQWQHYKTKGPADEIRIRLNWFAGIGSADSPGEYGHMPIRVEIRQRGTSTWLKMPVTHFGDHRRGRSSMRKEIRLMFVDTQPGGIRYNYNGLYEANGVYYMTSQGEAWEYHAEAYFQNTIPTDQIPNMTGNTTGGVTMSASSFNSGDPAWEAADNSNATAWQTNFTTLPAWIKVDFGAAGARIIKSYLLSSGTTKAPTKWQLQGSNDDVNWTVLDDVTFNEWWFSVAGQPWWFQVSTPGNYRYYRVFVTAMRAVDQLALWDLRLSLGDAPGNDLENAAPTTTNIFAKHANLTADGVEIYLDTAVFPKGEYEVRVKRGLSDQQSSGVWDGRNYTVGGTESAANFFNYYDNSGTWAVRRDQNSWGSQVVVEQFATIEHVYPFAADIHTKGVAMIAIEVPNVRVDSISAIFHSVVPVYSASMDWTLTAATSNPAALARHVLLANEQNADALPGELVDEPAFVDFFNFCASAGHVYNGVVEGQSVIDVYKQVLAAGYAAPDWNGQWSVIWEFDRTAETPVQVFTPADTRGLAVSKIFAKLPQAFRPTYNDEDDDYAFTENALVYMDGFDAGNVQQIEELNLPGFTDSVKVAARALFDLRQLYLRKARYTFEIGLAGLACNRGDLVMLNHDVVSRYHAFARIKTVLKSGPNVTGLVLESKVNLAIAVGEVEENMAAGIQFANRTTTTQQVVEKTYTDTVTFVTPFTDPGSDLLLPGMSVGFGVVGSTTKRMLVLWYEYVDELTRRITLIDEAPGLHA